VTCKQMCQLLQTNWKVQNITSRCQVL
jgi:hypothetical protein